KAPKVTLFPIQGRAVAPPPAPPPELMEPPPIVQPAARAAAATPATPPATANWPTFEVPAVEITPVEEGAGFDPVSFDANAFELPPLEPVEAVPVFTPEPPAEPTIDTLF